MSARVLSILLAPAALAVAGTVAHAQCPPCPAAARACQGLPAEAKLETRTYSVADLVIPIRDDNSPRMAATTEDRLIQVITSTIQPDSWAARGSRGTIDYFPLTMSLVINQTAGVQEQVANMLTALRRQQDLEVAVEVRVLTVSDAVFEKIAPECTVKEKGDEDTPFRLKMLSDGDVVSLLETAQGDRRTNVMQAPKITLFNGQQSTLRAVDQQTFITGVQTVSEHGQPVFVPKTETIPLGFQMALRPAVSADRRYVQLDLKAELSALESDEVPLFPVMTQVRPVGENQGESVTFTQMIQRPKLCTVALNTILELPDGGTALLCAGRREREVRDEIAPPVLSDIPALNRLFTKVVRSRQGENVLLLVTPRVLVSEEKEECLKQAVATKAAEQVSDRQAALARLLGKYRKACAEGRRAEAKKLAVRCLNLDPTCFK
jgi:hypothetical protein